jgi:hypothetical protein
MTSPLRAGSIATALGAAASPLQTQPGGGAPGPSTPTFSWLTSSVGGGASGSAGSGGAGSGAGVQAGFGAALTTLLALMLLRRARRADAKRIWRSYLPEVPPA